MAIYADGVGYNLGNATKPNWSGINDVMLIHQELDFGKINAERLSRKMTALATGDSIAALLLEEGMYVQASGFQVALEDTGSGARTASLGIVGLDDSVTDDALAFFQSAIDIKTKGYKTSDNPVEDANPDTPVARANKSFMVTEEGANIALAFPSGVPTNAVIRVWALVARVRDKFDEVYQVDYNNRKYDSRTG